MLRSFICLLFLAAPLQAELRMITPVVILGELRGGVAKNFSVAFTNAGALPLEILTLEKSCGCLATPFDRKPLPPGGQGEWRFDVRPLGQPDGPHTWFIKVHYRQGTETRTASLQVEAVIRNEVVVQPTVLAFFSDQAMQQEINILDRRGTLKILQVHGPDCVTATPVGGKDGRYKILVATPVFLPLGRHEGTLVIVTDDPVYDQFRIPIVVHRTSAPAVSWNPEVIRLEDVAGSVLVKLRSLGGRKVVIDRVEPSLPAFACTWASTEEAAVVRVRIDRSQLPAGRLTEGIKIYLSEPTRGSVVVPVE